MTERVEVKFSTDTLGLFQSLLDHVSIQGSDPDFEAKAKAIVIARKELAEALEG